MKSEYHNHKQNHPEGDIEGNAMKLRLDILHGDIRSYRSQIEARVRVRVRVRVMDGDIYSYPRDRILFLVLLYELEGAEKERDEFLMFYF